MSTGDRIPWGEANVIAQDCVAQLAPHCPDKPTHVWVFDVNRRVYPWATRDGMTGPLPLLPGWLVRRERVEEGEAPTSASDLEPGV